MQLVKEVQLLNTNCIPFSSPAPANVVTTIVPLTSIIILQVLSSQRVLV